MSADFIQQITDWVELYPYWASAVVFLVALLESLALVGILVPGVAIMFAIGSLVGTGALDMTSTVLWAACGASLGDGLSFALGWHFKDRLYRLDYFKRHEKLLDRGHKFFHKFGAVSVLIGRFVGPIRAIVPLIAGMMEMPVRYYLPANLIASALWAPAYLAPGLVFGKSYVAIFHWLEEWWILVLLVVAFLGLAHQGLRRLNVINNNQSQD